jgi:hypothetical protein
MTSDRSDAALGASDEATPREESTTLRTEPTPRVCCGHVAGSLQVELPDSPPTLDPVAAALLGAMIQRAVVAARQDGVWRPNA